MKLPRGHTPRVTADGRVEVHRHDEEGLARGGFGERMLRSLGWRDGDGLGVGRQGRAEAVRVTQKLDNKGVGANKATAPATDWGDAWWERAFDQGAKKHRAGGSGSSSSSSSSSSDSDSADSCGDASTSSSSSSDSSDSDSDREGKRKKRNKRKEGGDTGRHRDGTVTSATAAEMGIARALALDPWGRFGGRDGKMARIARMEREAAAKASAALHETLGEKGKEGKEEEKEEEEEEKEEEKEDKKEEEKEKEKGAAKEEKKKKKRKKEEEAGAGAGAERESSSGGGSKAKKRTKAGIVVPPLAAAPEAPETPPFRPPAGWWGTPFFVHAGRLEGIPPPPPDPGARRAAQRARGGGEGGGGRGFTAADQEALAERTAALKAAGKRGLGAASSRREKAVGHDWKGSKVVFGDGSDGDGEGAGGGENGESERRKRQKKERKSEETPPPPPASSLDVSSLKWKKAVEAALRLSQESGGKASKRKGLPVAELAGRVARVLFSKVEAKKTWSKEEDLEAALNRSLLSLCDSSSRFEVDGKGRVKLAAAKK